ncbi:MAG: N-acetylmuramoyl-L-alanine amidase [Bacillota bacterium]|nr:N-acetylmuramoyl-L-alanine amidase [Bacillota bacterium]
MVKITNVRAGMSNANPTSYSEIHIESNSKFSYFTRGDNCRFSVRIPAATPNLPTGLIPVQDGLIKYMEIHGDQTRGTTVDIQLDYPVPGNVTWTREAHPARLTVRFPRYYLQQLFGGRTIVLDPGHGGIDTGHRGAVNLLEKDVAFRTAVKLEELLVPAGANVILTRRDDKTLSKEERLTLALEKRAEFFISLHTHWSADPIVKGCAVNHNLSGTALADKVIQAIHHKVRLRVRRSYLVPWLEKVGSIPALFIQTVTISDWVEEGLLRTSCFHRQMAQAIFNGLRDYLLASNTVLGVETWRTEPLSEASPYGRIS